MWVIKQGEALTCHWCSDLDQTCDLAQHFVFEANHLSLCCTKKFADWNTFFNIANALRFSNFFPFPSQSLHRCASIRAGPSQILDSHRLTAADGSASLKISSRRIWLFDCQLKFCIREAVSWLCRVGNQSDCRGVFSLLRFYLQSAREEQGCFYN